MKKEKIIFSTLKMASSLLMMVALLWLTVSTPFVYAADNSEKKEINKQGGQSQEETNPFSSTTEEKNESSVNSLSEYLHNDHCIEINFLSLVKFYNSHCCRFYLDHHPQLLSPPPKA